MVNEVIITTDKGKVVKSKSDILIDDRPKYVEKFTIAGGTAILHTDYQKTISELKKIVKSKITSESIKWIKTFESFRKTK
jgi:5'(3')-deoxyribonucleotidase